jgi:hypothetical protein
LFTLDLVRGLPLNKIETDGLCDACIKGKQTKLSFKSNDIISTDQPLQFIHIDLFGPIDVSSFGRKRYVCVIIDDFSRFA